jgi:hypothetical protein
MALTGKAERARARQWEQVALLIGGCELDHVRDAKGRKGGDETVVITFDDGATLTLPAKRHDHWLKRLADLAEDEAGDLRGTVASLPERAA